MKFERWHRIYDARENIRKKNGSKQKTTDSTRTVQEKKN